MTVPSIQEQINEIKAFKQYKQDAEAAIQRLVRVIDVADFNEASDEMIEAWYQCAKHGDFERGRKP